MRPLKTCAVRPSRWTRSAESPAAAEGSRTRSSHWKRRSPQAARELIQRLSQRLREADDRIVKDERRSGRPHGTPTDADSQTALVPANNPYLAAKDPWLQRQFHAKLALTDLPLVVREEDESMSRPPKPPPPRPPKPPPPPPGDRPRTFEEVVAANLQDPIPCCSPSPTFLRPRGHPRLVCNRVPGRLVWNFVTFRFAERPVPQGVSWLRHANQSFPKRQSVRP